jgi:O-antigen ligase
MYNALNNTQYLSIFGIIGFSIMIGIMSTSIVLTQFFIGLLITVIMFLLFKYKSKIFILIFFANLFFEPAINTGMKVANTNIELMKVMFLLFMLTEFTTIIKFYREYVTIRTLFLFLLIVTFMTTIFSNTPVNSLEGLLDLIVFTIFIPYVYKSIGNTTKEIKEFLWYFICTTLIMLIIKGVFSFYAPFININKNILGSMLDLIIPIIAIFYYYRLEKKYLVILMIFVISLLLNDSRGSMISIFGSLSIFLVSKFNKIKSLIFLFVFLALLIILIPFIPQDIMERLSNIGNTNEYNTYTRFGLWDAAINIFQLEPLIGIGLFNFEFYYKDYFDYYGEFFHPHNIYLYILSGLGGIGFILCFVIGLYIFFNNKKQIRSNNHVSGLGIINVGIMYSYIALTLHGFVDSTLIYPSVLCTLAIIVSIQFKINNINKLSVKNE